MEDYYYTVFSDIDCDVYWESDICYYIKTLVYDNIKHKKKLRDLERMLRVLAEAIDELLEYMGESSY